MECIFRKAEECFFLTGWEIFHRAASRPVDQSSGWNVCRSVSVQPKINWNKTLCYCRESAVHRTQIRVSIQLGLGLRDPESHRDSNLDLDLGSGPKLRPRAGLWPRPGLWPILWSGLNTYYYWRTAIWHFPRISACLALTALTRTKNLNEMLF